MIEVPEVADGQQEDAEIPVREGESERSIPSVQAVFLGYRIRTNNTLLRDQLKIQIDQQWCTVGGARTVGSYPNCRDPRER